MFCTKCGAQMAEGQRFCGNCGAPVEIFTPEEARPEPERAPEQTPSFTEPPTPPAEPPVEPEKPKKVKKDRPKGKAKGWILGILLVIVAAAAALAIFRWNAVSAFAANLAAKTFSSPEEYYQRVEKNNVRRGLDAAEEGEGIFALYQEAAKAGDGTKDFFAEEKLQLSFDESALSDEVADLIEDELGMDLSWLNNLGFYLSMGSQDELLGGSLTAFLNDKDIIDADFALDTASGEVFFTVPRLSGQSVRIDPEEMAYASGLDAEDQAAAQELAETLLDEKLITTLIERGNAYAAPDGSGDVYFDVRSWPAYGALTHQSVDTTVKDGHLFADGHRTVLRLDEQLVVLTTTVERHCRHSIHIAGELREGLQLTILSLVNLQGTCHLLHGLDLC